MSVSRCLARLVACLQLIWVRIAPAGASTGIVRFRDTGRSVTENVAIASLILERVGGSAGTVTVTIDIEDSGTDAVWGVDYEFNETLVSWADGEVAPKAIVVVVLDNAVHNAARVVTCVIRDAHPPAAKGVQLQQSTLTLIDDGDAGVIRFDAEVVYTRELPAQARECLVSAARTGGRSGQASVRLRLASCEKGEVGYGSNATRNLDYTFSPPQNPMLWEDGDNDTRCLLYKATSFDEFVANASSILVLPDGEIEGDEAICLRAEVSGAARLSADRVVVVLKDEEKPPAEYLALKGTNVSVDLAPSLVRPGDTVYIRPLCVVPCAQAKSDFFSYTLGPGHTKISIGRRLEQLGLPEETIRVCACSPGVTKARFAGIIRFTGPVSVNQHQCAKGRPSKKRHSCAVELVAYGQLVGLDQLRILGKCGDVEGTPVPFQVGAKSSLVYRNDTNRINASYFPMVDTMAMARAEPGLYQMCWCTRRTGKSCTNPTEFDVSAGRFDYIGPYFRHGLLKVRLGEAFVLDELYGIGLTRDSMVRLQPGCGKDEQEAVQANASADTTTYNFGTLGSDRVRARRYRLCWCQPDPLYTDCQSPEDFAADIGELQVDCPPDERDMDGDGRCEGCQWAWTQPDAQQRNCEPKGLTVMIAILEVIFACVALVALFAQLELSGGMNKKAPSLSRRVFSLSGRVVNIEDISLERDVVILTTTESHYLNSFGRSIPVTLRGTGHFELDTTQDCTRRFRVVAKDHRRLILLDSKGLPCRRGDASTGTLQVSVQRSLMHTCVAYVVPAALLVPTAAAAAIAMHVLWEPGAKDMSVLLAMLVICAPLSVAFLKFERRRPSLERRLQEFERLLDEENPEPRECGRGPPRAVTVHQLLDLFGFFHSYIKDRTMYYLNPSMVLPLTKRHQLSYAERVGPHQVQWFVSHYWGTPFQDFCATIRRHAEATCVYGDPEAWKRSAYWICTFSNNQHRVRQELGGTLKESSFYLALRSSSCRGTTMILDEKALPLGRSWCLFELLQTILIKRERNDDFEGLLFCTTTGVINYGACTVEVAMNIGNRLSELDLENADATSLHDKEMINEAVIKEMHSFSAINVELRNFISAALDKCKDHVNRDFSRVGRRLSSCSLQV